MNILLKFVLSILILPVLVAIDVFRSERSVARKIGYILVILILFVGTWVSGYRNLIDATKFALWEIGALNKLTDIQTRGKSMLPTINDGETVTLNNPKKFGIERGDLVTFQNIETGAFSYLKRVVGLEGESILIKN